MDAHFFFLLISWRISFSFVIEGIIFFRSFLGFCFAILS